MSKLLVDKGYKREFFSINFKTTSGEEVKISVKDYVLLQQILKKEIAEYQVLVPGYDYEVGDKNDYIQEQIGSLMTLYGEDVEVDINIETGEVTVTGYKYDNLLYSTTKDKEGTNVTLGLFNKLL